MGFLTDDNDFHCFSIVDKDFDRLLMDEIGWSGFSIDEVSFHSFPINHINFPEITFKETSFHAMHLYEIVSPGGPLNEVILVFLSPLMKAVFIDSTSEEWISENFLQWCSLRLTSNQFNWFPLIFFQSKRYPRVFIQWNRFSKKFSTETFSKKFHFTDFNFMEFKSIKTAFSVIPVWNWISSAFPLMELVLTIFPWNKSVYVVSLCTKLNFVACSWMETRFLDFQEWN